jgi:ABC-2 type transport system permease protein
MRSVYLTFHVYLAFVTQSFQKRMQYRVANLAGLTTNFFFLLVHIFVYTAFYKVSTAPQPLNLDEVITYFVLCQVFFMLMPFWGTRSEVTSAIKDGSVALQLTKPVDFQAYWFADECGRALYYLLMRGFPTFLISILFFKVTIPQQPTVFMAFTVSMVLAVFMSNAITITIFSSGFWTLDTTGISGMSYSIITLFSGMLVPIALWPEWLAHIARWLPFEGLIDIPFSIYLGKITGIAVWIAIGKQMVWNLFFIGLGRLFLTRGFSRLVIQGG